MRTLIGFMNDPRGRTFQFVPLLNSRWWNVSDREVHTAQKVVFAPRSGGLGHLLEIATQTSHAFHLIETTHGIENRRLVVMIPGKNEG